MIVIKQPTIYFSNDLPNWIELYDRMLVSCECGSLMEKGMGLCNKCIDHELLKMQSDLENM
jgi:hypothetical protein